MAWVSNGNTQSGYTLDEIDSMTQDAINRVRQMQNKAGSYISNLNGNQNGDLYLEARELDEQENTVYSNDENNASGNENFHGDHGQEQNSEDFYEERTRERGSENHSVPLLNNPKSTGGFIQNNNDIVSIPFLKGMDSDTLIIGAIMFMLLQEGADKFLLMALAYILL